MAIQLGSAYGKVGLDVSGLLNGVKQGKAGLTSLTESGMRMNDMLSTAGKAMTVGVTLPIILMGRASIKAASDFEETKNKAVVVFGEMSDAVVKNANTAATTLGMSKKQYLDYASSLGAAFTAGGLGIKESTDLAEQAVKHFADLASFHNTQVEDASLAWQSAIRGQFEPIQKYFPFITNQYLITYGTANGMLDSNTKNLTANERAVILNAIALDSKLNPALNDFARTSGGLANQQRILKAQFNDSLIMLGENLLPIALEVVKTLNSLLTSFNNLSPGMQKAVIGFAAFLAILGPILTAFTTIVSFITSMSALTPMLGTLGISLGGVGTAAGAAGAGMAGLGTSALAILGPLLLIIATVGLVYLAFKNDFGGITTTVKQAWFLLGYYIAQGVEKVKGFFKNINWGELGKSILQGLANGLLGGIPMIVMAAAKAGAAALEAMRKALDSHSPSRRFYQIGMDSGTGYSDGLKDSLSSLRETVNTTLDAQLDFFNSYYDDLEKFQTDNAKNQEKLLKEQAAASEKAIKIQANALEKYKAAAAKFWSASGIPMGQTQASLNNSANVIAPYMEAINKNVRYEEINKNVRYEEINKNVKTEKPQTIHVVQNFSNGVTVHQSESMINAALTRAISQVSNGIRNSR